MEKIVGYVTYNLDYTSHNLDYTSHNLDYTVYNLNSCPIVTRLGYQVV